MSDSYRFASLGALRTRAAEEDGPLSASRWALKAIAAREDSPDRLNDFISLADSTSLGTPDVDPQHSALAGVPVAVKDNIATVGLPTTCGSKMLRGYQSPYEATVIRRIREAGGVILGKTNLDEFAMGSSTEHSAFGPTLNPHDRTRVPGGSSGGSAAAVASGVVPVALGSETGGSVRQPAAFSGVVGVKPTYGRVSRYGLVAFASSLDHVGTFGRTVECAAQLLATIAGHDPFDSTCSTHEVPPLVEAVSRGVEGMVIGVPEEYFPEDLDIGVREACETTLRGLEGAGATIRPITLPNTRFAVPAYYVICTAEASSNLARFDGIRYGVRAPGAESLEALYVESRSSGFGWEVKRRILLGTFVLSAGYYDEYYARAQRVRDRIRQDFDRAFSSGVDAIFTPTTPGPAFRLGDRLDDPIRMYLSDVFTVTANLAGIPAASVPIGASQGLPIGGQVLAPHWDEEAMFRVAGAIEGLSS